MKRFNVVLAIVLVVALAVPTFASPFTDVPVNHWAYKAVSDLVAAGIVEGYPDGTYKGQNNMTRYEMAMFVARLLDNLEAERAALAAELEDAESGLSKDEALDVTAICQALIDKSKPEPVEVPELPEGLTEQQAEEAANLIEALTFEYEAELKAMGQKLDVVRGDVKDMDTYVKAMEARIEALENATPVVAFSGEFGFDYRRVETEGTGLVPDDGAEYYYVDPFNAGSGWWVEDVDADTDNEVDESADGRFTDEEDGDTDAAEDYYEALEPTLSSTLDLNVAVNKAPLSVDMNMKAFETVYGVEDDTTQYELSDLTATVTTDDFVATYAEEQELGFKDYLFDASELDGVVVTAGDETYFLAKDVKTEKDYYNIVANEEDDYFYADVDHTFIGAKKPVDFVIPVNVYFGYEYAKGGAYDAYDSVDDELVPGTTVTVDDVRQSMVAFDTAMNLGGFDLTTDLAFEFGDTSNEGRLFRLGLANDFGLFDVAFNYENTEDMVFIEENDDTDNTEGYDFTVGTTLGIVDASFYYEDYDEFYEHTISFAVPAGNVSFAGIDVDGSYELTQDEDEGLNEVRAINASTDLSGVALTYTYDYDVDNEIYDETKDRLDDGVDQTSGDYWEESDDDVNEHIFAANYNFTDELTAGVEVEIAKAVKDDANDITFEDSETTTTLTGRYTTALLEAGFEKVVDGDLTIDGSVTAPTMTLASIVVDASAAVERNVDEETQNLEFAVAASKAVTDKFSLNADYAWADKEIDVDFAGVKTTYGLGAEYKITKDVSATAGYDYLNFVEDVSDDEYTDREATAGVSLAF